MNPKKILSDLYYGNVRPVELSIAQDSEYRALQAELCKAEEQLETMLTDEQNKAFQAYREKSLRLHGLRCEQHFTNGFQTGGKMAIAMLHKDDEDGQ